VQFLAARHPRFTPARPIEIGVMGFESAKTRFVLDLLKKVIRYPFLVSARCAAARDPDYFCSEF
jgi:hypothetical protein